MATAAAEMIDRLFMLHVRRFGFRVITYLESYTMFVASTINILDLKEGIDAEGASSRIEFSLELFRNAASTPSNLRCVEIIEQLLRKNDKSKQANRKDRESMRASITAEDQAGKSTQPSPTFQQPHPTNISSKTGSQQEEFSIATRPETSFQIPVSESGILWEHSGMSWPEMNAPPAVDQPLQWLPDNIGDAYSWMLTNMDFTKDFENHVP
jgi:hypothetical protein